VWASPQQLHDATGFSIDVDDSTPVTPDLSAEEREILVKLDPRGVSLTEL
jgi:hypothetical protein